MYTFGSFRHHETVVNTSEKEELEEAELKLLKEVMTPTSSDTNEIKKWQAVKKLQHAMKRPTRSSRETEEETAVEEEEALAVVEVEEDEDEESDEKEEDANTTHLDRPDRRRPSTAADTAVCLLGMVLPLSRPCGHLLCSGYRQRVTMASLEKRHMPVPSMRTLCNQLQAMQVAQRLSDPTEALCRTVPSPPAEACGRDPGKVRALFAKPIRRGTVDADYGQVGTLTWERSRHTVHSFVHMDTTCNRFRFEPFGMIGGRPERGFFSEAFWEPAMLLPAYECAM